MKKSKKKLIIILSVVALFVVFIGVAVINSKKSQQASAELGMSVDAQKISTGTISANVVVKGSVEPSDSRIVYSSVTAKVDSIYVNEGDQIKEGDSILSFNEDDVKKMENKYRQAEINKRIRDLNNGSTGDKLKAAVSQNKQRVSQLEIGLKENKIALKDARDTYNKNKSLFEAGALSQTQLDASMKQVESLERKINLDTTALNIAKDDLGTSEKDYMSSLSSDPEQSIQQLQIELENLTLADLDSSIKELQEGITSPLEGKVLEIAAKEGQLLNAGTSVVKIADVSKKVVNLNVNEFDAPLLKLGQDVIVKSPALSNKKFMGKVTAIAPQAKTTRQGNSEIKTVTTEVTIEGDSEGLKPGFTVNCDIQLEVKEDVIVVPIQSTLRDKEENYYVFLINDENVVEKRIINIGLFSELNIEATGVEIGETIILNPSALIKEGQKVNPTIKEVTEGVESDDKN